MHFSPKMALVPPVVWWCRWTLECGQVWPAAVYAGWEERALILYAQGRQGGPGGGCWLVAVWASMTGIRKICRDERLWMDLAAVIISQSSVAQALTRIPSDINHKH